MRCLESMPRPEGALSCAVQSYAEEDLRYRIRGDVFITMRDVSTGALQLEQEHRNLVVLDASILIARLMKDNQEPPFGALALAVGTGGSGWDLQNPPAPAATKRALFSELARKTFVSTQFVDGAGAPTVIPTNVVDFTTTFAESEAVGPLVEMGLLGGNISSTMSVRNAVPSGAYDATVDLTSYDTLINTLHFPVINKPPTSTFSITWRLTF